MGVIWIKCPATGRQTSTGIDTDAKGFADFPDQLNNVRCPACGIRHSWLKEDAWLAEPSHALLRLTG